MPGCLEHLRAVGNCGEFHAAGSGSFRISSVLKVGGTEADPMSFSICHLRPADTRPVSGFLRDKVGLGHRASLPLIDTKSCSLSPVTVVFLRPQSVVPDLAQICIERKNPAELRHRRNLFCERRIRLPVKYHPDGSVRKDPVGRVYRADCLI